jgi:hypothetical protein
MNAKQIHRFVERYLEATGCTILEKSPAHFKVKLSPAADRELTNRPYYWSFVDRTGAEPETMSLLFVTDPAKYDAMIADADAAKGGRGAAGRPGARGAPGGSGAAGNAPGGPPNAAHAAAAPESAAERAGMTALSRVFGYAPAELGARMPRDDLHFGSRRLEQIFAAARRGGRFVCLFQQPDEQALHPYDSHPCTPWLGVNVKVAFVCDLKREEMHAFGVSLATGTVVEQFFDRLQGIRLTPRLPANVHVTGAALTIRKAADLIEQALMRKLKACDYGWAAAANDRLKEELALLAHYYEPLIEAADGERKAQIAAQYEARKEEIRWQLRPRVTAEVVNAGLFHLTGLA